ncbi:MAG: hypothetical protein OXT09_00125 [Myxococcales bacterium]|nr:hypothetical protein [Myxococcales bacterium]
MRAGWTLLLAATLAVGSVACGGAATPAAKSAADLPPPPPAIPVDALDVLPAGAQQVARVDLTELRGSEHFPRIDGWARRMGCIDAGARDHWLLRRGSEALVATYAPAADAPPGTAPLTVVLVAGKFVAQDGTAALHEAARLLPTARGPRAVEELGRFRVERQGRLAASVLDRRWLLVGDGEGVERVLRRLDTLEGPARGAPLSADETLAAQHGFPQSLSNSTITLLGSTDRSANARIRRQLRRMGAGRAGAGLAEGPVAAQLMIAGHARAEVLGTYQSTQAASEASKALRGLFSRANLLMRLAGLGPILDEAKISVEGEVLRVSLSQGSGATAKLFRRLDAMIRVMASPCAAPAEVVRAR